MNHPILLVVDDDAVSRMLPKFMLHAFPVSVFECDNGMAAHALMTTHGVSHVLLDISMPHLNGIDVAKGIRAEVGLGKIKLVAYTADARAKLSTELQSVGFDDILIKPIKQFDLLRVLNLEAAYP